MHGPQKLSELVDEDGLQGPFVQSCAAHWLELFGPQSGVRKVCKVAKRVGPARMSVKAKNHRIFKAAADLIRRR